MKGPIKKFTSWRGLNKKVARGKKKRKDTGSTFRDYRGVMGVVEDAQRKK